MTREEIKNTPEIVDFMLDKSVLADSRAKVRERLEEVCNLAIKALEQEPCDDAIIRPTVVKFEGTNMACIGGDEIMKEFENSTQQNNDKAISLEAVIQTLNKMDRYTATELTLCDTDKKFPANEVFIVDDVYEQITEQLPSVTQKYGKWILSGGYWRCSKCKEKALLKFDKSKGGCREYKPVRSKHCPNCGAKMQESEG